MFLQRTAICLPDRWQLIRQANNSLRNFPRRLDDKRRAMKEDQSPGAVSPPRVRAVTQGHRQGSSPVQGRV